VAVGLIFRDINALYHEIVVEMEDFRGLANDAWRGMIQMQGRQPSGMSDAEHQSAKLDFASVFGRVKRGYNIPQPPPAGGYNVSPQQPQCSEFFYSAPLFGLGS